jgi:predicted nucleotidyltransferase
MDVLGKLFGNPARVKIMRLFLLNPVTPFEVKDVAQKSKTNPAVTRKEVTLLQSVGLVEKTTFFKEHPALRKGCKPKKKRVPGFQLNEQFPLLFPLKNILMSGNPLNRREELVNRFKGCGKIKLIVVSGIFVEQGDSRVDVLIVGDDLEKRSIEHALRGLEAEMGKELTYAFLETQEFLYRTRIYDKFIRDIFDYPHEKVMDKLGLPT